MKEIARDKTITLWQTPFNQHEVSKYDVKPASGKRDWIDREIPHMYRCLPVLIANQSGWTVHLPCDVEVLWRGGGSQKSIHFWTDIGRRPEIKQPANNLVDSIFGAGIFTFFFDFFIRTPHKINLLVRGAPNFFVDGAHPLEGLVETDWLNYTFTMNWRATRPDHLIRFRKDDPICFIQPMPHRYGEEFDLKVRSVYEDHELLASYQANEKSRDQFRQQVKETYQRGEKPAQVWQRHYFDGIDARGVAGASEENHTVKTHHSTVTRCPFGHGDSQKDQTE